MNRNYYLVGRIGKERIKRRLGPVTLEYAKLKESEILHGGQLPQFPSWQEARYAYCAKLELEQRSQSYRRSTAYYLSEMATFWGDDKPINEIDAQLVKSYFRSLLKRKKPYSAASLNRRLSAGRGACNFAGLLTNPFLTVKKVRERERTAYLSDDERTRLLDCALQISRQMWEVVQTAVHTGLRKSEILGLRWDQIDFDHDVMVVIQKGDRQRPVYMNPFLKQLLSEIPRNGTPYVWIGRKGQLLKDVWRKSWAKLLRMSRLEITFHDLRHDYATRAYRISGDIRAVQGLLGHSSIGPTMRYAHVVPEHLKAVARKLWDKLDPRDEIPQ